MPVVRASPAQSSIYRKLLACRETWRSGLHVNQLGWRRFRVLTLTSSAERRNHLIDVSKEVVAQVARAFSCLRTGRRSRAKLLSRRCLGSPATG